MHRETRIANVGLNSRLMLFLYASCSSPRTLYEPSMYVHTSYSTGTVSLVESKLSLVSAYGTDRQRAVLFRGIFDLFYFISTHP
jgi:hypothetical protein